MTIKNNSKNPLTLHDRCLPLLADRRLATAVGAAVALFASGCAQWVDAPRLHYQCPHGLQFEARLYEDMAVLEGMSGHVILPRVLPRQEGQEDLPGQAERQAFVPDGQTQADDDASPRYADVTVQAHFGLGQNGRLVRLDYTNIPEPVLCQRVPTAQETARTAAGHNVAAHGPAGHAVLRPSPTSARAQPRPGPRNAPPFDPNAPVQVNYRSSGGKDSQGEGKP